MHNATTISDDFLLSKILQIRHRKVLLDRDLAELYGVPTKRLNEQVKRNRDRFPEDFMFQLTAKEKDEVVANCDHLAPLRFSRTLPYAFTEHGSVMLASVLNSPRAIDVNVRIVRLFNAMREVLRTNHQVLIALEKIDKNLSEHGHRLKGHEDDIETIFGLIGELREVHAAERNPIGFKVRREE